MSGASPGLAVRQVPRSALAAPLLIIVAVLLEVSVMPYLRIADGSPDLVAAAVVAVGLMRGPLSGAVAGFSAGLLIELAAPIGTLGVFALLYLAVGALAGRYWGRPEASRPVFGIILSVAAAGGVELGYAAVQALLGNTLGAAELVGAIILPTMALTALLAAPVLLVARRLLGDPAPRRGGMA